MNLKTQSNFIIYRLNSFERFLIHRVCKMFNFKTTTINQYIQEDLNKIWTKCDYPSNCDDSFHGYQRKRLGDLQIFLTK